MRIIVDTRKGDLMDMRIKEPMKLRGMFDDLGWGTKPPTIEEIADQVRLAPKTVSHMLHGRGVRYASVKKMADFLNVDVEDIAEMVKS
jgi:DNA-binding Xre family transcriptional regulator